MRAAHNEVGESRRAATRPILNDRDRMHIKSGGCFCCSCKAHVWARYIKTVHKCSKRRSKEAMRKKREK
jgi:hypothetical protein